MNRLGSKKPNHSTRPRFLSWAESEIEKQKRVFARNPFSISNPQFNFRQDKSPNHSERAFISRFPIMDVIKSQQLSARPIEKVVVHPLVLLSIVDNYYRVAKDTRKRVVGVLLGSSFKGTVDVTNSYAGFPLIHSFIG